MVSLTRGLLLYYLLVKWCCRVCGKADADMQVPCWRFFRDIAEGRYVHGTNLWGRQGREGKCEWAEEAPGPIPLGALKIKWTIKLFCTESKSLHWRAKSCVLSLAARPSPFSKRDYGNTPPCLLQMGMKALPTV